MRYFSQNSLTLTAPSSEFLERMREAMREASRIVLGGFELETDHKLIRYPDRYMDERGTVMWERVMKLINEHQERRATWPWILH